MYSLYYFGFNIFSVEKIFGYYFKWGWCVKNDVILFFGMVKIMLFLLLIINKKFIDMIKKRG